MVAATWNKEFDLNDEVDEIREALRPKGFEDIDRETVLKCLSAVQLGTVKEQSLMTLRKLTKEQMKSLISQTKAALLRTVDLLSTEFNIYSWDFLSYEAIVVIVCYIYAKIDHLSPAQILRLRQWFWQSAFGERYKVGGEGFVSNDLKTVHEFAVTEPDEKAEKEVQVFGKAPTRSEWHDIAFRSNVSRSRAFILALAAKRPRNLTNGAYIDTTEALSSYNKKQFHHIFPRAHLRRIGATTNDNLIINICMIAAAGNNAISDDDPQRYLPRLAASLGHNAKDVFASNLLPSSESFDYSKTSYEEFLDARAALVTVFINELCSGHVPEK